jgi:hypothetical protein
MTAKKKFGVGHIRASHNIIHGRGVRRRDRTFALVAS